MIGEGDATAVIILWALALSGFLAWWPWLNQWAARQRPVVVFLAVVAVDAVFCLVVYLFLQACVER